MANSVGVAGVDLDKVWSTSKPTAEPRPWRWDVTTASRQDRATGGPEGQRQAGAFDNDRARQLLHVPQVQREDALGPTDRDATAKAELELRKLQRKGIEHLRKHVPGCEKAFIARTSPTLNIRRARVIACDYDITLADVTEGRHFDDDVMAYGFHDMAPGTR